MQTMRLQSAYLCPGDEQGAHITDNSQQCACGNRNLISLSKLLNRVTIESADPIMSLSISDLYEKSIFDKMN